jgi:hypothetical protein
MAARRRHPAFLLTPANGQVLVLQSVVLIDHAATFVSASSGRSVSVPFSKFGAARTSATRRPPAEGRDDGTWPVTAKIPFAMTYHT